MTRYIGRIAGNVGAFGTSQRLRRIVYTLVGSQYGINRML